MDSFSSPRVRGVMRVALIAGCCLFAVLAWPEAVAAQVLAAISGVVTDASDAAVAGAAVAAKHGDTGLVRETTTDGTGRYVLAELPLGALYLSP